VSNAWTSTKALSVYNVLLKANLPLSLDEVCALLQKNWRADVDDEYVAMGAGYLMAKGFVSAVSGRIAMAQPGKRLVRVNDDIDLNWAS
jgi:hypothetical protein